MWTFKLSYSFFCFNSSVCVRIFLLYLLLLYSIVIFYFSVHSCGIVAFLLPLLHLSPLYIVCTVQLNESTILRFTLWSSQRLVFTLSHLVSIFRGLMIAAEYSFACVLLACTTFVSLCLHVRKKASTCALQQQKQAQMMCYASFGLRWVFLSLKFVFFWYLLYVLVAIYELCEREASNNKNELKWCITRRLGVRWVFFPLNSCFFDTNQCLIVCIGYLRTTWEC